jgi:aspartate carbamoyltransferase catalytic subunit
MALPKSKAPIIKHQHLLSINDLSPLDITALLDLSNAYVEMNRKPDMRKPFFRRLNPDTKLI